MLGNVNKLYLNYCICIEADGFGNGELGNIDVLILCGTNISDVGLYNARLHNVYILSLENCDNITDIGVVRANLDNVKKIILTDCKNIKKEYMLDNAIYSIYPYLNT